MYQAYVKPTLDVLLASIALIILFVPLLLVATWIKLDSRGPVLFRQLRSGKNRVPFTVYKFRSMAKDAPANSSTSDLKDAHMHITRSGKIIRKLSIDELPQLINVLKGDMSLVGPRPVILKETSLLDLREKYEANTVKPGITGWAQVNGRDRVDDITKAEMDGFYAKNTGLILDTKCVLMTIWVTVTGAGHTEGHEQDEVQPLSVDGAKL